MAVGPRSSRFVTHYSDPQLAVEFASRRAGHRNRRHSVVQTQPGVWSVFELFRQPVGHCSQCGRPYPARACGPTHAVVYHEMQRELVV